ncbi:LuxR C-terminal-related transcriptional regulator [Streptomyces olivaceoviridis]|uniref:LuxR C-terminal-related transcriptional regulator n=1 Tax=Streptomyces olivaceoviridis TaxID=1921 RepID=UPI0036FB2B8B
MDIAVGELDALSGDAIHVFSLIAAGEHIPDEMGDAVDQLLAWGYVVRDSGRGDRLVALNPEEVSRRRLDAELKEAAERVQRMSLLPSLTDQLAVQYERAQWVSSGAAEYIDDPAVVNARLDDVVGGAQSEILSAQPGGPRTRVNVDGAIARDTAALDRGVELRTLYRATVRDHALTSEYARMMSTRPVGRSAEYRTLVGQFERCIVVDRKVAFISNHLVEGAPAHAAWQITCRATVAYIAAEFEAKWRRADPWYGERSRSQVADAGTTTVGVKTTRRQREILRELVEDRDQRAIAQRLGLSLRTVTAEITELKALLGASSLPGLAFRWALHPDRAADDSALEGPSGASESAA